MIAWYGILYVSKCGEKPQLHDEIVPTPLSLQQCDGLLGQKFFSISNDGENIIVCCKGGNFTLYPDGKVEQIDSDHLLANISSGDGFSVGISDSGQLYSWGWRGETGQLGHGAHLKKVFKPLEINFKNTFTALQCGKAFTVALDETGRAYAWGENYDRQLGIYNKSKSDMRYSNAMVEEVIFSPRLIPLSLKQPFAKLCCGERFTMAITNNGELYSWGAGESGQLGTGRCTRKDIPTKVSFDSSNEYRVTNVACGDGHVIASVHDMTLYSWGLNHRGQCGLSDIKTRYVPCKISNLPICGKLFANAHSSAMIDGNGDLWTWGSTRNGRLLHSIEEIQILGEHTRLTGSINLPTKYCSSQFAGSRFETFCFATSRVGVLVKTTLTKVWPTKGPKRTFSRLYIHGFGLWRADQIIVRFSSKIPSIYNPPRSCMAKLIEPGVIVCKPPKFAEVGIYAVEVSMDGGKEFLSQSFEILIYKEVVITQQLPSVIDLRNHIIPNLYLRGQGTALVLNNSLEFLSIMQHNKSQGMEEIKGNKDDVTVKLLFHSITHNPSVDVNHSIQFLTKATAAIEYPTAASADDAIVDKSSSSEGLIIVECENVDLTQVHGLGRGLYEVFCQLSFNEQDFPPLSKEASFSVCHTFTPETASPSSYSIGELNYLVELYNRQQNIEVDSLTALQNVVDFHAFERKVTVCGESLFPSNKLQKGSHIMTSVTKCTITNLSSPSNKEIVLKCDVLGDLEELIVHGDSTSSMHFTLNSSYLRQVQALIRSQCEIMELSTDDVIVKVFFSFQIETPSMGGMEKLSLSDKMVPFFFFPTMKPSLSKSFYLRSESEGHVITIMKEGNQGFPFEPSSSIVRLHAKVDGVFKSVFEINAQNMSIQNICEEGGEAGASETVEGQKSYQIQVQLPSWDAILQNCSSTEMQPHCMGDLIKSTFLSLSLDGLSIPQQLDWKQICYYSTDISKCTLQTAVPKGGAPGGSQVSVIFGEFVPTALGALVRVRLRGVDPTATTTPLPVSVSDHEMSDGVLGSIGVFTLPESSKLAQVAPTLNGKEKMYYIDVSVDSGERFECAPSPILQVK